MTVSESTTAITNIDDPRWLRAISHPLRSRVLAMLADDPASPVLLAKRLGEPLGRVAYHVRLLFELGLLDLVSTRQRRGATEHYYKARQQPRFSDDAWAQLSPVAKQRVLAASLGRMHEYAMAAAAGGGFDRPDAHFTRTALQLDEQGWAELAEATKRWLQETTEIEEEAAERLKADPHAAVRTTLTILLFESFALNGHADADDGTDDDGGEPADEHRRAPARAQKRNSR